MFEFIGFCLIAYFLYRVFRDNRREAEYQDSIDSIRRTQQNYKEIALSHGWKIDDVGEVPSGRYQLIWMYKKVITSQHGELDMQMLISTEVKITFRNEFLKIPEMNLTETFSGEFLSEIEDQLMTRY